MGKLTGPSFTKNLALYKIIANNVKHLRIESGKTQLELSLLVQISNDSWGLIESGKTRVDFGLALAIADLFCLPSAECLSTKDFYKTVGDDWREKVVKKIEEKKCT